MDLIHFLSGFIGFILALILVFLLRDVLPSYLKTKATNQATKEDIGEITDIVESIKTELLKKTEELKAQLNLKSQNRLNIKKAEQEALYDFNRKYTAWIYYLVRYDLLYFNEKNYQEIDLLSAELQKRQYEADLAEGNLELFYNDEAFYKLKYHLATSIIKLGQTVKEASINLKFHFMGVEKQLSINSMPRIEVLEESHKKVMEMYKNHRAEFDKKFEQVVLSKSKLGKALFERISIIEEELAKN